MMGMRFWAGRPLSARWLAVLALLCGFLAATDIVAQDRNPWAEPEPGSPTPTLQPRVDGRFAPRDYNPVNDRQRRDTFRFGEPVGPDPSVRPGDSYSGPGMAPGEYGMGAYDPATSMPPWSSLYGVPGTTGYPGLFPYGTYPGSGMLWPGTGLTTPGLGMPLYGAPLGSVPLLGTPYQR